MKVVILAGGRGSRLAEETTVIPKPMVEIGGRPMLWHIMRIYAAHGFKDFIVACGYKGQAIEAYFADFPKGENGLLDGMAVACIDTGGDTMTGGRLLRLAERLADTFMLTYGDGVGDIDISALVRFHGAHGRPATVTAVRPPARFGGLELDGDRVGVFAEKSPAQAGWINGGFFVLEPEALGYIAGDDTRFEAEPLTRLAEDGKLMAYRHHGFWKPMDTLREKMELEAMWREGTAQWAVP